ncbi:MAG: leucine-rich repeat domain-containing protein, partial [Ruminiclostridium sp.]|nr:leucine-rich repeat domain-containing protein [Ruminiclostridium sp.]
MKKILGLIPLLGLLLVLTCAPASALSDGEYEYTLQNNEVRLDKYIGSGGDITIPTAIRGIPVTAIGDRCFAYTDDVTSIYVPGTVREIGIQAFAQTDQAPTLKKVVIAEGANKIGDMAFNYATGLTDVQLPTSLANSLSQAKVVFKGCDALTHISLPYGMTAITYHMFEGCDNLRSVSLPATIQTIGEYAF